MAEIEQNQSQMSEENDESVSTGWSARWAVSYTHLRAHET